MWKKVMVLPRSSVEYATDNITVYRYCGYSCVYCWAWRIPLFRSRISRGRYDPVSEAEKYLKIKEKRTIVVSFTSDPYPPIEILEKRTRKVLEVLSKAKQHKILVLTKNPALALRDIDLMKKHGNTWLGTTVITLNEKIAGKIEIGHATPLTRLLALAAAHDRIKTWISIEPIIPYITYPEDIIEATRDYVDWYVLGAFNYYNRIKLPKVNRYIPSKFTKRELETWYRIHVPKAIKLLKEYNKPFFIKKELKKYLGDGL